MKNTCFGTTILSILLTALTIYAQEIPSPIVEGKESGGGGGKYGKEFKKYAKRAMDMAKTKPRYKFIDFVDYEKRIVNVKVNPVSRTTLNGREVLAINYPHSNPQVVKYNTTFADRLGDTLDESVKTKTELAMHEILSLMGIESDDYYPYSESLFDTWLDVDDSWVYYYDRRTSSCSVTLERDEPRNQILLSASDCEHSFLLEERVSIPLTCKGDTCVSEMNEKELAGRYASYLSSAQSRKIELKILPNLQSFSLRVSATAKPGKALSWNGQTTHDLLRQFEGMYKK